MPTPVLAADAGSRSGSVRWASRVVSAALAIGAGAILLSLLTQAGPSPRNADPSSGTSVQKPTTSTDPSPTSDSTTPSPTRTSAVPRTADTAAPEPAAATPSPTATPEEPVKNRPSKPGNPPTAPPGKPK